MDDGEERPTVEGVLWVFSSSEGGDAMGYTGICRGIESIVQGSTIDREEMMRHAMIFAVMMLLIAGVWGSVLAQSETTVVGTGVPAFDVANVQHAVDNYDIVDLVGTFHFGDDTNPYTGPGAYLNRGGIIITESNVTVRSCFKTPITRQVA